MTAPSRPAAVAALLIALTAAGCDSAIVAPLRYGPPPLAPDEAFRARVPAATPVAPEIELPWHLTTLPNGVRVALLERHAVPVVTLEIVLDRGAADAGARPDAYAILQGILQDGTDAHSAGGLMDAWARLGAVHTASLGPDGGEVWAKVGAADFDAALSLLAETATRQRLTAVSLDRVRGRWTQGVGNGRYGAGPILARNTRALLFGRSHAYGYGRRTVADTNALRVEDLAELHAQILQPAHGTLVVVGDVSPEAVAASAARLLGTWAPRATAPLPPTTTPPPPALGARAIHVERRDDTETQVSILARGPAMGHADLAALEILARSFGGISSQMRGDVIAERGAAYFFSAGVTRYRTASFLSIHAPLAGSRAMPALRAMLDLVAGAAQRGISEAELARARTSLLSDWRALASTTPGIAALAADALAGGQSLDEVGRYPARLQAVTLDDVRRVAAHYLAASALRLVVLGSPSLRPELEGLGLGPVERRDEWAELAR